jgi:hypothetical protein
MSDKNKKYRTHERRASRRAGEVAAWIGLGVTIGLYIFFTIWWASGINLSVQRNTEWIKANQAMPTKLSQIEAWIENNQELPAKISQIESWVKQNQGLPASIGKIEANFEHLSDKLNRVTDQLDRLDTKMDTLILDKPRAPAAMN